MRVAIELLPKNSSTVYENLEVDSGQGLEELAAIKKSEFTDQQIAFVVQQAEAGVPVKEVCRKLGISQQTIYRWEEKHAGLGVAELHSFLVWSCKIAGSSE